MAKFSFPKIRLYFCFYYFSFRFRSMRYFKFPAHIHYLFRVYLWGILCFTLFRIVLLVTQWENIVHVPQKLYHFSYAFLMGWRFDSSISGYLLVLPLLFFSIWRLAHKKPNWLASFGYYFINTTYILAFFICAIDIPYFDIFASRLNIAILNWVSHLGFGLGMVAKDPSNWAYTLFFFSISYLFCRKSKSEFIRWIRTEKQILTHRPQTVSIYSLLFIGLAILAIRGRISEKSPIRIGTAYFSEYTLPNQLGLNPVFTFLKSYLESQKPENKHLTLLEINKAKEYVALLFGTNPNDPAKRSLNHQLPAVKMNVVLILMESMTAAKMERYGNKNHLTPFLDSLALGGLSFDNTHSCGIHTFNGIYSTLFGQPALLGQHPMNKSVMHQHTGFSHVLSENGYQTIYFTTHDDQFDNVGGFLTNSYFQKIISQSDYPSELVQSTLGVPDHEMFRFSIPILDQLYSKKKPFFATFMTASDHMPYVLPKIDGKSFGNDDMQNKIVRYADWSLKDFFENCQSKPWFSNTLFVFVADHGVRFGKSDYDPPLSLNHIPFIVYGKNVIPSGQQINNPANQTDVFPTIMGLLHMQYTNHTLGSNVLMKKSSMTYFCADDKICSLNDSLLYIYRVNGPESLHFYSKKSLENVLDKYPREALALKEYAFAMLQTSQWMVKEGITK